jgi:hypothetical protein
MTKEKIEALMATTRRFTNLIDGDIIPNVGVISIISYYEDLLHKSVQVVKSTSNIERKFQEEEYLNEADYWDEDESINFLQ